MWQRLRAQAKAAAAAAAAAPDFQQSGHPGQYEKSTFSFHGFCMGDLVRFVRVALATFSSLPVLLSLTSKNWFAHVYYSCVKLCLVQTRPDQTGPDRQRQTDILMREYIDVIFHTIHLCTSIFCMCTS